MKPHTVRRIAYLFTLLALAIAIAPTAPAAAASQVLSNERLRVAGSLRSCRLVVPEAAARGDTVSLVIALHGMAIDSKDVMPLYSGLDTLAAMHGFVLAYSQATGGSWGLRPAKVTQDLRFFDALVSTLGGRYTIDPRRIYVVGMSNGGYFAHLIARERTNVVAAMATHSGPLGLETLLRIGATRKFPVFIAHGDRDQLFPIAIARENRDKYRREGHPVTYVEVPGLGHAWSRGIEQRMWTFFAENPMR